MEKKDGLFDGNSGNSDVNGWFGGKKHGTTLGNLYAVWYFNWWKFGGGFCSISKDEAFSFSQGIRMGGEFLVRNQMQKLQPPEPMFHHGLFGSLFLQTIPKLHSKRKLLEPQRTGEARKGHTHTHCDFPLFLQLTCSLSKQDWMKWTMWCYVWRRRFAGAVCGCILSKLMIEFLDLLRKTVTWDPLTHCKILEMDLFPAKCWVWFRNNNPSQLETQPGMGEDVTCGDDLEWRCIGLISEWNLRHPFCLMSYVGLLADNAFYKAAKLGEWLMIEEPGFATSCKESRYPWNRRW